MRVLGIETSCDETAAAVVEDGHTLLSNVIASSMDLHAAYGGVVPEIAARSHIESIMPVITEALQSSNSSWSDIDALAVTQGPGLGGSLLIGVLTARTLALVKDKPLYAVNHVAAHPFANFITHTSLPNYSLPSHAPSFPMLALIVSGGHTQLVLYRSYFDYTLLGQTRDDAIGEAFDKVAKIIGLPYPGGPSISRAALHGDPTAYPLPKAHLQHNYDFSFSGLKTAVLRTAQKVIGKDHTYPSYEIAQHLTEKQRQDLAASFQYIAIQTVVDKTVSAYNQYQPNSVVIAGGVAANAELRAQLKDRLPLPIQYSDIKLCTDNGAMVASYGCFALQNGMPAANPYNLDIAPNFSM
jgi:N6-L-threonylcarbamoyladenine synthase